MDGSDIDIEEDRKRFVTQIVWAKPRKINGTQGKYAVTIDKRDLIGTANKCVDTTGLCFKIYKILLIQRQNLANKNKYVGKQWLVGSSSRMIENGWRQKRKNWRKNGNS